MTPRPHPAKFSAAILPEISKAIDAHATGRRLRVLDPFAGVGLVHTIDHHDTWGVEIEPEWACQHPRTIVGDATLLPFPDRSFDVVATSPTYGNRMADTYDGAGQCKAPDCEAGKIYTELGEVLDCPRCKGTGRDTSKRYTYRIALGRRLHPRNTARMQWGPAYWHTHWTAWHEARRVLRPGGLFVLNVSNSIRRKELIPVVGWHRERLIDLGFSPVCDVLVETPRMGHGANRNARDDAEHVLIFTAPQPKETPG